MACSSSIIHPGPPSPQVVFLIGRRNQAALEMLNRPGGRGGANRLGRAPGPGPLRDQAAWRQTPEMMGGGGETVAVEGMKLFLPGVGVGGELMHFRGGKC